jgi:hypothetical protein
VAVTTHTRYQQDPATRVTGLNVNMGTVPAGNVITRLTVSGAYTFALVNKSTWTASVPGAYIVQTLAWAPTGSVPGSPTDPTFRDDGLWFDFWQPSRTTTMLWDSADPDEKIWDTWKVDHEWRGQFPCTVSVDVFLSDAPTFTVAGAPGWIWMGVTRIWYASF